MASSSGTASLAMKKTLIATKQSLDEVDRNAYKQRKMLAPAQALSNTKPVDLKGSFQQQLKWHAGSVRLVHTSTN
jgi:hypothetical protein